MLVWFVLASNTGPKHVRFPFPGFSQSGVITFFRISTSLCLFSFQGQNNFISLMNIHVLSLASLCRICGDEIEDHKRKVDTNRFVSEIHRIWNDLMLLDSPNVHPPLKNNQRKKANFKCKWSQQIFTLSVRLCLRGTSLLLSKILQAMPVKPRPLRSVRFQFEHPNDSLQWIMLLFSYMKCFLWNIKY